MINGKRVLGIIPARGGSKRLPRKNVLELAGKPLIGWTIEAAQQSNYIDDIFVSTDCEEISAIATKFNVHVPELRPSSLATDEATTKDVILYTLEKFGKDADIVLILQPTSPLREAKQIDEAIKLYEEKQAFSVVSVTPCEHPPMWSNHLPSNHSLKGFIRPEANCRSQELSEMYRLNGAIYTYNAKALLRDQSMDFKDDSFAYIMPQDRSIDIDSQLDFIIAEAIAIRFNYEPKL